MIITLLFTSLLQTSHAKNQLISCQETSVQFLEDCLSMHSESENSSCWQESKNAYGACYKRVINSQNKKLPKLKTARKESDELQKEPLKDIDKKSSYASHSFVLSTNGHKKERTKQKTIHKAEQRALIECQEHNASSYRIKPARCSLNKNEQHHIWNCMTIVSCFGD